MAAVSPLRPMMVLCGLSMDREPNRTPASVAENTANAPRQRQNKIDVDLALAASSGFSAAPRNCRPSRRILEERGQSREEGDTAGEDRDVDPASSRPPPAKDVQRLPAIGDADALDCQITTMAALRMMARPIVTIAATKVGWPTKRRIKAK